MRLHPSTAILLAMTLGSCSGYHSLSETYDLAEVANVNARNAISRTPEIIDRLDRIEQRLGIQ